MLLRLTLAAIDHGLLVIFSCLAIAAAGAWSFRQLPHDVYPDISPPEVTIITIFPGRAPEEIERQLTIPIELAMSGVPYVSVVRSRTIYGLSVVEMVFEAGVDKFFARNLATEGLGGVPMPQGVTPQLGPLATGSGEIYRYELQSDGTRDLMEIRGLNDWVVIPRLRQVPGVADVADFGGYLKQYTLKLDPRRLDRYGFTIDDIVKAVQTNNASSGGGIVRRGDMSFVIRGRGLLMDEADIESTVVSTIGGTPIHVRDVASVELESRTPVGIFGKDGRSESVEGIVLMNRGENPVVVPAQVEKAVAELNAGVLPAGVRIVPFYDRQLLVESAQRTIGRNMRIGVGLAVLAVLVYLSRPGLAIIIGLSVPFALLAGLGLMGVARVPVSLFSISAIDFGILVTGAVVVGENIVHRLSLPGTTSSGGGGSRLTILEAAAEVQRPVLVSLAIIAAAYLPLLTLADIEGLLFRRLVFTKVFVLAGAALFAVLVIPALASLLIRSRGSDCENLLLRWIRPVYAWTLRKLLAGRWLVLSAVVLFLGWISWRVVPHLEFDFLPFLDEGVIWVRADFPAGMSIDQTAEFADDIRAIALKFPDVTFAASQVGRSPIGTDPFPPSRLEMMIGLNPDGDWVALSRQDLVGALGAKLRAEFPTTRFNFTQPLIDSVTEDTNGTSADLAVEFSGPDLSVLLELSQKAIAILKEIRGAVDVNIEQQNPQPQLVIRPDRGRCAQYGVKIEDVNQLINTALGGEAIGTFYEGERRFDIVARFDRALSRSRAAMGNLPVYTDEGVSIPLSQVADFSLVDGQTIIARIDGRRRMTVRCDIVGHGQARFVSEAQRRFAKEIDIPDGYNVRWIGMFENLDRAIRHFALAFPLTVLLVGFLLRLVFRALRDALLVLSLIPVVIAGGVLVLHAHSTTLSVSNGVGLIALCGVFIMDAVLMIEWITNNRRQGDVVDEAIVEGALGRLRPILMITSIAILGTLPATLAGGLGSDVQRPVATIVAWGLLGTLPLKLFVLPVLYRIAWTAQSASPANLVP